MGDAPEDFDPGGSARTIGASRQSSAPGRTGGSAKGQRNQGGGGPQAGGGGKGGSGKGGGGKGGGGKEGGNRNGGNRNRNGNNGGRGGSSGDPRAGGGRSGSRSGASRPSSPGRPGNGGSKGSPASQDAADVATDPRRSAGGAPATPATDRTRERNEEESARVNRRRAVAICLAPGVIVGAVVGAVLAVVGLEVVGVVVFVVAAVGVFVWLWRRSPGAVLRSLGATPSDEWEHPRLHNLVDGLCATMGLPRPAVWVVGSPVPNAMAVGRDPRTASLVVTSGLEQSLSLVELEGVLAHELVHIKRRDTVVAGIAVAAVAPLVPFVGLERASERVHSLVGRGREFSADQRAASVVRYPPGINSALDAMAGAGSAGVPWPPGTGRLASLTRWLWIDPMAGVPAGEPIEGNLDDTRVRAAAWALD
jgi:Zn-dependent protease with chaperone function